MGYLKYFGFLGAALLSVSCLAASSDEIQVYDEAINDPGELNVDVHLNYVTQGIHDPSRIGEIPANHNFRITPEFGYGVNQNWEAGLYLPVIRSGSGDWYEEGAKVRMKYVADHAEQGFYWGLNQELGDTSSRTSEVPWNYELRPIIGYKTEVWNFTTNPIFEIMLSGNDHKPEFSPQFKIDRRISGRTWCGIEQYAELGTVDNMRSHVQETYLTIDTEVMKHDVHFGVGHGWTSESNDWTIKAIYNIPL